MGAFDAALGLAGRFAHSRTVGRRPPPQSRRGPGATACMRARRSFHAYPVACQTGTWEQ